MKQEDLDKILESIKSTIGEDVQATIADNIGELITKNSEVQQELNNKEEEITKLKDTNAKLISANGALLQQIPTTKKEETPEATKEEFLDYHSVFDENGNFI